MMTDRSTGESRANDRSGYTSVASHALRQTLGPPGERVPALSDDAFADSAAAVETALTAAGVIR